MKRLFYILFFFLPVVVSAQFNLYKDSPLDYVWKNVGNAGFSIGQAYQPSLAINPIDGSPYMGYDDGAYSDKAGKTRVLDHPLPIFVDHNIFLTINKVRWSDCSGEDWSKRAFFSPRIISFPDVDLD